MCTPTPGVWQPAGCVSCELVCVCVSLMRVVIICLASTHTALVSSPSLGKLKGAVHVDQVLGVNAGDWLEWTDQARLPLLPLGLPIQGRGGSTRRIPTTLSAGQNLGGPPVAQTKMVEWLEVNNAAQLAKRKPLPDDRFPEVSTSSGACLGRPPRKTPAGARARAARR